LEVNGYGQIIRDLRLAAGLTQRELAAKLDCTDGFLAFAELERRFPSTEFFQKLIEVLKPSEEVRQNLLDAVVAARRQRAEQKEQVRYAALTGAIKTGGETMPPPLESPQEATSGEENEEFAQAVRNLRIAYADTETRPVVLGTLEALARSAQAKSTKR
jgi:transcriptional regulator with XRE-family HTH domain